MKVVWVVSGGRQVLEARLLNFANHQEIYATPLQLAREPQVRIWILALLDIGYPYHVRPRPDEIRASAVHRISNGRFRSHGDSAQIVRVQTDHAIDKRGYREIIERTAARADEMARESPSPRDRIRMPPLLAGP